MRPLAKILLPVDYSERCRAVAVRAIPLAEFFGAEITALRVLNPVPGAAPGTRGGMEEIRAANRDKEAVRLRDFVTHEFRHCRAPVRSILREGDPAAGILNEAAGSGSDLIMMPTHGLNPFRRLLLGSVAARCLHAAGCPVWLGPHTAREGIADSAVPGAIVYAAAQGSEMSRGLEWAAGLAAAFRCMLTVLHLAPRADLPAAENSDHPWRCRPLEGGSCGAPGEVVPRHILLETGDIARAVPRVAEQLHAGLLVLDRAPWGDAHPSIDAYAIVRSSSCLVLRL